MTTEELQAIVDETLRRETDVPKEPDLATLPTLKLDHVRENPEMGIEPEMEIVRNGKSRIELLKVRADETNGMTYFDVMVPLDGFTMEQLTYLPLFSTIACKLGDEAKRSIFSNSIGWEFFAPCKGDKIAPIDSAIGFLKLQILFIRRNADEALALAGRTLWDMDLDKQEMGEAFLRSSITTMEESLEDGGWDSIGEGSLLADVHPINTAINATQGIPFLASMRTQLKDLEEDWPALKSKLENIKTLLSRNFSNAIAALTTDTSSMKQMVGSVKKFLKTLDQRSEDPIGKELSGQNAPWLKEAIFRIKTAPSGRTDVLTTETDPLDRDSTALCGNHLALGARFSAEGSKVNFREQIVARAISREHLKQNLHKNAGCKVHLDTNSGALVFSSFSDPAPLATLDVISKTGDWLRSRIWTTEELETLQLETIAGFDGKQHPARKGVTAVVNHLSGETKKDELRLRKSIFGLSGKSFASFAKKLPSALQKASRVIGVTPEGLPAILEKFPDASNNFLLSKC